MTPSQSTQEDLDRDGGCGPLGGGGLSAGGGCGHQDGGSPAVGPIKARHEAVCHGSPR